MTPLNAAPYKVDPPLIVEGHRKAVRVKAAAVLSGIMQKSLTMPEGLRHWWAHHQQVQRRHGPNAPAAPIAADAIEQDDLQPPDQAYGLYADFLAVHPSDCLSSTAAFTADYTPVDYQLAPTRRVQHGVLAQWLSDNIYGHEVIRMATTIYVLSDTQYMCSPTPSRSTTIKHWEYLSRLFSERVHWIGQFEERVAVLFVPIGPLTGLDQVPFIWGVAFILEQLRRIFPHKHLVAWDNDAAPCTLWEVGEPERRCLSSEWADGRGRQATLPYVHTELGPRRRPGAILIIEVNTMANAGIVIFPAEDGERAPQARCCELFSTGCP